MKNYILILILLSIGILLLSCADEQAEAPLKPDLEGAYFKYDYPDCNNTDRAEENCTQWIKFYEDNRAEVLYGGGDIIWTATYSVSNDKIYLIYESDYLNEDADGFDIVDKNTLLRFLYNEAWTRVDK